MLFIKGREYDTVGVLTDKNPKIEYQVVWGNVVWGTLLFETIVAPIYFYGFSIEEPVRLKTDSVDEIGTVRWRGHGFDNSTAIDNATLDIATVKKK